MLYVGCAVDPDGQGRISLSISDRFDAPSPSPLPTGGPVAPATDVPLAPGWTPYGDERSVHVVEGSTVVHGPHVDSGLYYWVMLRVPGELLPVMRGYEEQFIRAGFDTDGLVGREDEPVLVTSAAGGGTFTAVGVEGDPSYVLIERQNDP